MSYQRKPILHLTCHYRGCGKTIETARASQKFCSNKCFQAEKRQVMLEEQDIPRIRCLDCGASFVQLGTHVIQAHGYDSARQYRITHGLDPKRGTVPLEYRRYKGQLALENNTVENLAVGAKFRFEKGDGRAAKGVKKYWKYKKGAKYE